MKIKRQKKVHRYLNFYKNNFGFRAPYQVLIDGTFCQAALTYKVNIKEQLPKYFDSDIKFITTACVIIETERLGPKLYGATLIVKQFVVHKCGHEKSPLSASKCLLSMFKQKNEAHYFLATQDLELRRKAQKMPAVPILYLTFNAPTLEKPSCFTEKLAKSQEDAKFVPTTFENETLKNLKREHFGDDDADKIVRKKKRKKGGPNPLSCKKRKKRPNNEPDKDVKKKSRARKKIRVAKHVKEHFKMLAQQNAKAEIKIS